MATELNYNDDFFANIIPDMPGANNTQNTDADDFLSKLFGNAPAPTPATEAPAAQPKAEEPKAEEKPVQEAQPQTVESPAEEAKEEVKAEEPAKEAAPETAKEEAVQQEETAPVEAKAPVEPEAKAEEAPAPKEAAPVEPPKAEEAPKAKAPAEPEAKAEEVVVETSKPKRAKRSKRASRKEAQKLEVPEVGQLDENFIPTLLLSVGSRYEQYKQEIQDLMNEIELTPDMNKATVQTMIAKQTKLAKMIEFYGEGYHDALENLAGKDGMIDRIVLRTAQETEGTATEKKDAGRVACMNYVDPKTGEHQDLMQWKKGLESAVGFFSRAADYCKTVGVALSTYSKLY